MKNSIKIAFIAAAVLGLSSCYKNYYDVSDATLGTMGQVSFRSDVVPIITSGACGCHNNGSTRQVGFMHGDTIFYSAILSRSAMLNDMANGGAHPGEGSVYFTPSQASIIKKWYQQGATDDYVPPPVTGNITYSQHIVPLYRTDCRGGSCHGGSAVALDLTSLKNDEATIRAMMNSYGASGHPGGPLSIAQGTAATFLAWIAQGYQP